MVNFIATLQKSRLYLNNPEFCHRYLTDKKYKDENECFNSKSSGL